MSDALVEELIEDTKSINVSRTLGMEITTTNKEYGYVEAKFNAENAFTNDIGHIQGGMLLAMLDELMTYAGKLIYPDKTFSAAGNVDASFILPAAPGMMHGRGQVMKLDGDILYLTSHLFYEDTWPVASAVSKSRLCAIGSWE